MCMNEDCEGAVSRRAVLAGVAVAASSRQEATAQERPVSAPTRVLDDPTIVHGRVHFVHNGSETIDGYLARPKAGGRYPAVLVVAGNKISEEYIPNTCAALALACCAEFQAAATRSGAGSGGLSVTATQPASGTLDAHLVSAENSGGLPIGIPVLAVLIAGLAYLGIRPRLNEYRG